MSSIERKGEGLEAVPTEVCSSHLAVNLACGWRNFESPMQLISSPKTISLDLTQNKIKVCVKGRGEKLKLKCSVLQVFPSDLFPRLLELVTINLSSNSLVSLPDDICHLQ